VIHQPTVTVATRTGKRVAGQSVNHRIGKGKKEEKRRRDQDCDKINLRVRERLEGPRKGGIVIGDAPMVLWDLLRGNSGISSAIIIG